MKNVPWKPREEYKTLEERQGNQHQGGPLIIESNQTLLRVTRDLLLPGCWAQSEPDVETDLSIDFVAGEIVCKAWCKSTDRLCMDRITLDDIKNKSFIDKFRPMMISLVKKSKGQ